MTREPHMSSRGSSPGSNDPLAPAFVGRWIPGDKRRDDSHAILVQAKNPWLRGDTLELEGLGRDRGFCDWSHGSIASSLGIGAKARNWPWVLEDWDLGADGCRSDRWIHLAVACEDRWTMGLALGKVGGRTHQKQGIGSQPGQRG
jgi:hypothetical protein